MRVVQSVGTMFAAVRVSQESSPDAHRRDTQASGRSRPGGIRSIPGWQPR